MKNSKSTFSLGSLDLQQWADNKNNSMNKRKLQTALIQAGKEVEAIKDTPSLAEMEDKFERFKIAIQSNDMRKMRLYGRQMTAHITRFMIDKL